MEADGRWLLSGVCEQWKGALFCCKHAKGPPFTAEGVDLTPVKALCREAGVNRSGNTGLIVFFDFLERKYIKGDFFCGRKCFMMFYGPACD